VIDDNLPLTAALREKLNADTIDVGDVLAAHGELELKYNALRADNEDYARIHAEIRRLLEPHFPPSTIASCIRDMLADMQRMDKLERDGVLKALYESSIPLKDFHKETWYVRKALDAIPEPEPTPRP